MITKKKLKFIIFGFLVLLLALFPVGSAFANGLPALPHAFYGTIKYTDGIDVEAGKVITAKVGGVTYGSYTIHEDGHYGDNTKNDYLLVQGEIDDGAAIHFYVGGQKAEETFPFHSGWTTNLNLTVAPTVTVTLTAEPKSIPADGSSTSTLTATVMAEHGNPVKNGTEVAFTTDHGVLSNITTTTGGVATATLTSGLSAKTIVATITATADDVSDATAVFFIPAGGAGVVDSKTQKTESGDDTVNATDEADTVVEKSGTGTPTVTVANYEDNPGSGFSGDVGKYIDIYIDDDTDVDELIIKLYYTDAEVAGLDELSLRLRWWDGDSWEVCSDSGVNAAANYMWAKVRVDTTPSLSQLKGTPFAGRGTSAPVGVGVGAGAPAEYLTVDFLGRTIRMRLDDNNRLRDTLIALSPDGRLSLEIEEGTLALVDGEPIYLIEIREAEECPPLPEDTIVAGKVYDITPSGATFDKDVILILSFHSMELPENTVSVTMAYYVSDEGWVELESEQGGVAELGTMTTSVSHFTPFAILAKIAPPTPAPVPAPAPPPPPPAPPAAHFVISELNIEPSVREIWEPITFITRTGESITISANVANDGGQEGVYIVELKINGETVDSKEVTLAAGQSQQVSFALPGMDYGRYEVEVAGLSGEFTVSRSINWWLIAGIIVAIGLIIWGVSRARRRAYSQ